jgi:predicted AAA+ superfamily ATPase
MAAWAANAYDWRAAVAGGHEGALMETFALADVQAWDGLSGTSRYSFWRTGAGAEVDLVVERGSDVVAIEIEAGATLTRSTASGLRALRSDLGQRFRLGVLAYLRDEPRVVEDRIVAVPLAQFLGAAPSPG